MLISFYWAYFILKTLLTNQTPELIEGCEPAKILRPGRAARRARRGWCVCVWGGSRAGARSSGSQGGLPEGSAYSIILSVIYFGQAGVQNPRAAAEGWENIYNGGGGGHSCSPPALYRPAPAGHCAPAKICILQDENEMRRWPRGEP